MFKSDTTGQRQLFAFTPRELIPEDCDVWLYLDLFDHLILDEFDWDYCTQGQDAHEPRLILRTLFYGLTHGVVSGRKLASACVYDSRFMVLSGENRPSYRTFSRFVIRHQQRMEDLFVQVVRLARKMGLVSPGQVAIDGSKFKANSSKHKAMSYVRMKKAIKTIKQELAKLREEFEKSDGLLQNKSRLSDEIKIKEKRLQKIAEAKKALEEENKREGVKDDDQKSFNDHDARPFSMRKGDFEYVHNCQAAVDSKSQIVVAAEVHKSTSDSKALPAVLDSVEKNCGENADNVLADSGYKSYENIEKCEIRGSVPYIALGKGETKKGKAPIQDLKYYKKFDHFRCMRGKTLENVSRRTKPLDKRGLRTSRKHCKECPFKDRCSIYQKKGKVFWIPDGKYRESTRKYEKRMRKEEAKDIYRYRKAIVEPIFGNVKNKGIRITVIGFKKVSCWWKMACTAHNIEKIIKQLNRAPDRQKKCGLFYVALLEICENIFDFPLLTCAVQNTRFFYSRLRYAPWRSPTAFGLGMTACVPRS